MTIEPGRHSHHQQPVPYQQPQPQLRPPTPPQFNCAVQVSYKGGWPGLFTGENQTKAVDRVLRDLNSRGYRVAAAANDRWSIWKRLGMLILAVISLGFYVRVPNIILITEPLR